MTPTLSKHATLYLVLLLLCAVLPTAALAQINSTPDMGKLLATGGVSQLEGAGGGGLTPWALITGYGTKDSYGGNAHVTQVSTQDYTLKTVGVALGVADRVELSIAKQTFSGSLAPLNALNIHDNMLAYVEVVDTPYFAKTDALGKAKFPTVASGKYTLKTWHYQQAAASPSSDQIVNVKNDEGSFVVKLNFKSDHASSTQQADPKPDKSVDDY